MLIGGATAFAQTPAPSIPKVQFDEAVQRAIEKNPTVAQAATSIARAEALLQQAKAGTLPSVSASFSNTTLDSERGFSGAITQPQNQSAFSGNVTVPVLQGARWAAVGQAKDQIEVANASAADVRRQIGVAAAQAYLAVIAQRRQLDVAERAMTNGNAHLDYATKRLQGGAGTRLNELRAQQEVTSDIARLEAARLALRRAQEALGALLVADGPIDAAEEPALEAPSSMDISNRTDVRLQRSLIKAADHVLADARRDWWPTGNVSFDPAYVTPAGAFSPSGTWRLTFSVTQPIYEGGLRKSVNALRKVNLSAAQLGLAVVENQARADVRLAQVSLDGYMKIAESSRLAAQQAAEVLKITNDAFSLGATTNLEVIDAQRQVRDAEALAVIADDNVRQARLLLLVALGRFPR